MWSAERESKGEKCEDAEKLGRQGSLNVKREGEIRHLLFIALSTTLVLYSNYKYSGRHCPRSRKNSSSMLIYDKTFCKHTIEFLSHYNTTVHNNFNICETMYNSVLLL